MNEEAKANQIFMNICHTRSVEWHDVSSVRHGGWKGPGYAPSFRSEINLKTLSLILRSMVHLNRLTLSITSDRLYHKDVLDVLKVLNLPHLRYLRLFLSFNFSPLAIEELFPLILDWTNSAFVAIGTASSTHKDDAFLPTLPGNSRESPSTISRSSTF